MVTDGPRRAAVLGHPVAHSLSPALHRAAYAALGLSRWTYDAVDVDAAALPAFLAGLGPTWAGLSLTMPLKQVVVPLLDEVSALASALGAVNTVTFGPDRRRRGENTDVHGVVAALRAAGVSAVPSGAVIGGGATAASAVAALGELGCTQPRVYVRSLQRAETVRAAAARLGSRVQVLPLTDPGWRQAGVVVCTLPARAADPLAPGLRGRQSPPGLGGVLLDVAYDPWPSRLALAWRAAGGTVVDGLDMLVHQAAAQVLLMTGMPAPVAAMAAAVRR